jgi:Ca-activated chloride channel family protein
LLLILPVLAAFYVYFNYLKRKDLKRYGDPALLAALMPAVSKFRPNVKFWLCFAAVGIFAVLLARPQFGSQPQTVKRQGVEVMIALDISNSMMAEDVRPNRLDRAKMLVSRIVDELVDDKIGLIVFAGDAFTQLPITSDYISAKMFLESITPALITKQGTAIGAAITLATRSFTAQEDVERTIILITDGENHEPGMKEAVKAAHEKGIQVNVIGVGTPEGAPIPAEGTREYRKDGEGNVVVTRLNEQMCREIAQEGHGIYARADNSNAAQRAVTDEINKLAKADMETTIYTDYNEQFQAVAWLVLLLLIADVLLLETKNPLFKRFKLFSVVVILLLPCGLNAQTTDARRYIREGNKAYRDSLFTDADVDYRKALEQDPGSATAMYNLGNALLFQNKAQDAMQQYEAASKIETDKQGLGQIYHNAGVIFHSAKEYQKAVEAYKQALRNNPKDDETRYNLALAQKMLKDQQQQQQNQDQQNQDKQQEQQDQQNKPQQQPQEEKSDHQQQPPPQQQQQQMSKENAEQMLNSVMQDEKETQERLQKKIQVLQDTPLQKDW